MPTVFSSIRASYANRADVRNNRGVQQMISIPSGVKESGAYITHFRIKPAKRCFKGGKRRVIVLTLFAAHLGGGSILQF